MGGGPYGQGEATFLARPKGAVLSRLNRDAAHAVCKMDREACGRRTYRDAARPASIEARPGKLCGRLLTSVGANA